ncbi:MAG: hypothetical protein HKN11_15950 [Rhizobiales bacterium]|nr:hypothetical protein [Hyphomicrobiales bacterium]
MNDFGQACLRFWRDTRGGSLLGYAVLISVVLGAAFMATGYQSGTGTWQPPTLISLPKWSPM